MAKSMYVNYWPATAEIRGRIRGPETIEMEWV